jgi:hypothetical protein
VPRPAEQKLLPIELQIHSRRTLKIDFRDNAKKLAPDYAEFMNVRRGLPLAHAQRSVRM